MAVRHGIEMLRVRGILVQVLPAIDRAELGCSYRLSTPVELLETERIRAAMGACGLARLQRLQLSFEVDSTNSLLLNSAPPPPGTAHVAMSELQHAGRGRRGRAWIAPFGGTVALSMGWVFADMVGSALSLCAGVAVVRALVRAGAHGIALKWPNDVWYEDRKVGGILVETKSETRGPAYIVIGVGVNVVLGSAQRLQIESSGVRAASVAEACIVPPSRNFIAGAMIDELLSMLVQFEREGFAAFHEAWSSMDALRGRSADVVWGGGRVSGTARGVNDVGALRLERDGQMRDYVSGEVSLRLAGDDI